MQQLIEQAATLAKPSSWDDHWKRLEKLKLNKLPYNAVVRDREQTDER
jgi:hypothetical protein